MFKFYSISVSSDGLMFGNHKNITPIAVVLLSSKLENLKKYFEARWGWNFFRGKSRVPRPRQSLTSRIPYFLWCYRQGTAVVCVQGSTTESFLQEMYEQYP